MPRLAVRQGRPSTVDLGGRIKAERERLGLSKNEVARRLLLSRGSYRQIETATALQYGVLLALVRDVGMDARSLAPELFTRAPRSTAAESPAP